MPAGRAGDERGAAVKEIGGVALLALGLATVTVAVGMIVNDSRERDGACARACDALGAEMLHRQGATCACVRPGEVFTLDWRWRRAP
jgi:hypothetical protein